jgi:hypothetical protein
VVLIKNFFEISPMLNVYNFYNNNYSWHQCTQFVNQQSMAYSNIITVLIPRPPLSVHCWCCHKRTGFLLLQLRHPRQRIFPIHRSSCCWTHHTPPRPPCQCPAIWPNDQLPLFNLPPPQFANFASNPYFVVPPPVQRQRLFRKWANKIAKHKKSLNFYNKKYC